MNRKRRRVMFSGVFHRFFKFSTVILTISHFSNF